MKAMDEFKVKSQKAVLVDFTFIFLKVDNFIKFQQKFMILYSQFLFIKWQNCLIKLKINESTA